MSTANFLQRQVLSERGSAWVGAVAPSAERLVTRLGSSQDFPRSDNTFLIDAIAAP